MSGPTPNPTHDDNGVPLCNQAGCGLFDGKRCKAVGFRPDRFCEPALVELVAERKALKRRLAEIDAERKLRLESADPDDETWHTREEYLRRIKAESELDALKATVASIEAAAEEIRRGAPATALLRRSPDRCTCSYDDSEEMTRHAPLCPHAHAAVTIEAPPPEGLLDRITPDRACRHTRRSLRPDPHGNPVTTCIDCGDETP